MAIDTEKKRTVTFTFTLVLYVTISLKQIIDLNVIPKENTVQNLNIPPLGKDSTYIYLNVYMFYIYGWIDPYI